MYTSNNDFTKTLSHPTGYNSFLLSEAVFAVLKWDASA